MTAAVMGTVAQPNCRTLGKEHRMRRWFYRNGRTSRMRVCRDCGAADYECSSQPFPKRPTKEPR